MDHPRPSFAAQRAWRLTPSLAIFVWLIVAGRIATEATGRGAHYWNWDYTALFFQQHGVYLHPPRFARHLDYPPYALTLRILLLPPGLGWNTTLVWFTGWRLAALAVILVFAWRCGRDHSRSLAWLFVGSVLAMSGLRGDLLYGNLSTLMLACLVVLQRAVEQRQGPLAAAAWIGSLIKPQMGWLFGLGLLFRRQIGVIAGAVVAILAATVAFRFWTGVSPGWLAHQVGVKPMLEDVAGNPATNLVYLLAVWRVKSAAALLIGSASGAALAIGLLIRQGPAASVAAQWALIGVVNRICTYHNACDDLLLVFALILLGRRAAASNTRSDWATFLLLGATVWLPVSAESSVKVRVLVLWVWVWIAFRLGEPARIERHTLDIARR